MRDPGGGATEFGSVPFNTSKDAKGREHHAQAFTCWMAGAGVTGGYSHDESDDHGNAVATDGVHVHDFHATMLHLLGPDHTRLTYRHSSRDCRLTDVHGEVIQKDHCVSLKLSPSRVSRVYFLPAAS